jgi:hypothetical protein
MDVNYINIIKENETLKMENENLKKEIIDLEERLKKYTAPSRSKKYYETHKDEILQKHKTYVVSDEKKKEYARRAYLKKKEKIQNGN